jgi:hypothetical protein
MFTVHVSKILKATQVFQMPVALTEQLIPDVSALEAASGEIQPTGVVRINPDEQFVVHGRCQHNAPVQIVWTFTPPIPRKFYEILAEDLSKDLLNRAESLVVPPYSGAFSAGTSYVVKFECVEEATGLSAYSSLLLDVNAPPRGRECSACRLSEGGKCASSDPKRGEPIFDVFRYACFDFADEDGPLEYQFGYSANPARDEWNEFDWGMTPSMNLILPSGQIQLKARVRDSFGASTKWMIFDETLYVDDTSAARRRLLEDRWPEASSKLQESLDLQDFAATNQLTSALAMDIDDRVQQGADDGRVATLKKEFLFRSLSSAAKLAIKTEGYICEALSSSKAASSDVGHLSPGSVTLISTVCSELLASKDARSLDRACAQSVLTLTGKALDATYRNRTCSLEGYGAVQGQNLRQFLTNMDFVLKRALTMSSSSLLTGQQLSMQLSSNSSSYSFIVRKLQKSDDISMELDHMKEKSSGFGYSFPSEVMNDARLAGDSTIKVLFGYFQHPPNMNGINPISPAVSLSLATEDGDVLNVSEITKRINITIPVSTGELCAGAESNLYAGSVRCLYWDETSSSYRPDGCTAHRISSTQVTCMCTHLTTFVVEPVIPEPNCLPCNAGFFLAAACTKTSHRVCDACPENSNAPAGSVSVTSCSCKVGYWGNNVGACTACVAGKYREQTAGSTEASCTACGAGKYGVATGQTAEELCTACGAGKYRVQTGGSAEASCTACDAGKYGVATGQTSEASCTACTPNSNSPSQSSAIVDCTCNAGYSGPAGGPCSTSTSETLVKQETLVKLSLSLPFTKDEFTEDKQSKFRESLAFAADVKPADVKIDKIDTIGRRGAGRHLLAALIRVDTSIRVADNSKASSMINRLTADNINAELAKVGLPKSTILEAPKVANAVQGEPNIVPIAQPASSNDIAVGAGTGAGVGIVLILGLVAFAYWQARGKRTPKFEIPLSADRRLLWIDMYIYTSHATHKHATSSTISVAQSHYLTSLSLSRFVYLSLSPPFCACRGADQLSALPDSEVMTKRLHAFYSRVNPAKADQVRRSRAQTSKSKQAIFVC